MDIKHNQNRTIVPRRDVDRETNRPSKVTTRKMTAEEWAKYGPLSGQKRRVTTTTYTSEDQRRRSPGGKEDKMTKYDRVTKELVVEQLKKGKSAAQVAREYGMSKSVLYQKMRRWGVSVAEVNKSEVEELRKQNAALVAGLRDIGIEHGLKNTVNGIFEDAGIGERVKYEEGGA